MLHRFSHLARALFGLGLLVFAHPVHALDQLYVMAPAAPGGGWDGTARAMQEALQGAGIVRAVQVENVTGAGGTIGLAQFVKRERDGKALMATGLVMAGAILTNKSPVNFSHVTPIARLTQEWQSIAVLKNSDLKSIADLIQRLKTNPGSVSWGGGSAGGADQMTAGLFAKAVGADPAKVNYVAHSGGGQAMATILGGHVTLGVNSASEFLDQVQAGQMRYLAVSSDKRIPGIDAPTFRELGIDLVFSNWRGVMAPPGISAADKKALGEAIDKMVKSPQWKAILEKRGWIDAYMPSAEFEAFLKDERTRVETTLRSIGLVR
ncbi:MAG: tripartite tricarboxylate transporter substrate binding protein [Acidimicrobiia bacterium]|nr:tripartite tricarboxylate transporter substrate binding protein [Acidimicrobiia bacterium]